MSKLDEILKSYADQANIVLEQELPPPTPAAAPVPGVDPAAPAVPAGPAPAPTEGEEGKTKTLTDQGYVTAVMDMLELLSINPEDLEESDLDIFSDKVNPKNAMDLHDKLRELIDRYGSPSA
jgi:hypothetical protein